MTAMSPSARILHFAALGLFQVSTLWAQPVTPPAFDPSACVQTPQRVIVFDMKSGWWSGDGGDFHDALLARIVKDCPAIEIEYHFLQFADPALPVPIPLPFVGVFGLTSFYPVKPGSQNPSLLVEASIPSRPWTDYTQVWLLSGSNHDPSDVPSDYPFVRRVLAGLTQSPASIFVGTGLGHQDHANVLLAAFQIAPLFHSHTTDLLVPRPTEDSVEVLSRLRKGTDLVDHPLFEGADTIAGRLRLAFEPDVESDFLAREGNPFQVVGTNSHGEPAIAVMETETRRWVLDAGLTRFYSLLIPGDEGTYRYLQDIFRYLGK